MSDSNKKNRLPRLRFPGFYEDWEEKKFGEVISEDRTVSKTENEDTLLTSSIDGMFLNSEVFSHQRGQSTIGYRKIKKGMLVLSAQNLHLGNANVNMRFDSGLVSPAYKTYKITGCLPEFMFHWVKKEDTKQFFFDATTQGASECRRNVVWDVLYNQTILLPANIAEQQKIAECLSAVDESIAAQQEKVDALKAHKKGLMQQLFPQDGETTPRLRFPGFEGEWEAATISEVFDIRNGYTPSKRETEYWTDGTIPWFRMEDIRENGGILSDAIQHITPSAVKGSRLFKKDSIILATTATIGVHAMIIADSLANQQFTNFSIRKSLSNKYLPIFVYYAFFGIDEWCKKNTNAGGLLSVNMPALLKQLFYTPSLAEQQKIADCLYSLDDEISVEQKKLDALKAHKTGLMQQLFPQPVK